MGCFSFQIIERLLLMTLNEGNEHWGKCKQTVNSKSLLHQLCVFFLSDYRANFLKH